MVKEVDEHSDTGESQTDAYGNRNVRNEELRVDAAHGPQYEQTVDEGGDEGTQHNLIARVPQEVVQGV